MRVLSLIRNLFMFTIEETLAVSTQTVLPAQINPTANTQLSPMKISQSTH